ncbi:MAG: hypothetical protein KJ638_07610, partial [Chloroflexi bacterium]|nr:hypothetical protein [Chloroflexota bacterium]
SERKTRSGIKETPIQAKYRPTEQKLHYRSSFRSGFSAKTSSVGATRLGTPLRTIRVMSSPTPKRNKPYLGTVIN